MNDQTLSSLLLILAIICFGFCLSTVQPTDKHDPKTCLTVPANDFAIDFSSITFEIFFTCSKVRFPLCVTFLTFFLSLSYPPSYLITNAEDVGLTVISAALFWHFN